MAKKVTLHDDKIIDRWGMVIEDGQGNTEKVYKETEDFIKASGAPAVNMERVEARPSWLAGLFGREREYLMVTCEGVKDYRMYIGARDYGKNLDVQWYLTCEPGFFKKSLSEALTHSEKALSFSLDLFQQQDLTAYVTVIHHCMLKAVETLISSTGQDPSKIDRKSKGFLGIS